MGSASRSPAKADLLAGFARVGKALSSPVRLELLDLLGQAERSVEDLAGVADQSISNTSAQLQVLRAAGLVTSRRDGNRIWYRLSDDDVAVLYSTLRDVARRHLTDVEAARHAYLGDDDPAEAVTCDELLRRARAGNVTVLDVRPSAEYEAGHIADAISIPLDELAEKLATLPPDTEIVAYCRGPYCVLARQATNLLRDHGLRARHLEAGMLEWRLADLPVESSRRAGPGSPGR